MVYIRLYPRCLRYTTHHPGLHGVREELSSCVAVMAFMGLGEPWKRSEFGSESSFRQGEFAETSGHSKKEGK